MLIVFKLNKDYSVEKQLNLNQYFKINLINRQLTDGGFSKIPGHPADATSTALAVIALNRLNAPSLTIVAGQNYLRRCQKQDGRVPLTQENLEVTWPTALALIAWDLDRSFEEQRSLTVQFLLNHPGLTIKKSAVAAHDTSIPGWSWTERAYSWIEPTSFAVIALKLEGLNEHRAVRQGVKLIMDREIESGGWNYGNKQVFDTELLPMPESTGIALCALKNEMQEQDVSSSLGYLESIYPTLSTPLSLARAVYGLTVYNRRPDDIEIKISQCLKLEDRYGPFDTQFLAELAIAYTGSIAKQ